MLWIQFFLFGVSCRLAYGFSFTVSPPTQCGPVRFTWTGGKPPFYALVFPPAGTVRNISVPANGFDGYFGNFSTSLNLPEGNHVVFAMGDATGVMAGGSTSVMAIGPPSNGQNCDTSIPSPDFVFSLDGPLAQCKPYPFTLYDGAIQPITILVTVPHGEYFILRPPIGDSFNWKANLTAGTSVFFSVTDSRGRFGGTSDVKIVSTSNDSSCISPSLTPTSIASFSATLKHSQPGRVVGVALGSVAAFVIIVAFGFFLVRHRMRDTKARDPTYDVGAHGSSSFFPTSPQQLTPNPFLSSYDTIPPARPGGSTRISMVTTDQNETLAGLSTASVAHVRGTHKHRGPLDAQQQQHRQHPVMPSRQLPSEAGTTDIGTQESFYPTTLSSRASILDVRSQFSTGSELNDRVSEHRASSYAENRRLPVAGQRVFVHMDIEDVWGEEDELPFELPPQYSASRAPISGMPSPRPPTPPPKGR